MSMSTGFEKSVAEHEDGPPQLFAYLYASPLTQRGKDGRCMETSEEDEEIEGLDVVREAEDLKQMFTDTGKALSIRVEVATRESLCRTLQSKGVRCSAEVIHFTCHGLPDGFLALEDSAGQLDKLSAADLEAMLDRDRMPDVVFVSACFSHPIGDIFAQAGVKHVVAVRRNSKVADQVGKDFAKQFFERLVCGATVCDAFKHAQTYIELTPGRDDAWRARQREKFLLLPKQGVDHDVPVFDPGRIGEVLDVTPPPTINTCRRITSHAVGRKVVTQRIVQAIAARDQVSGSRAPSSRWLTICGTEGIGKTTCAIAACNFVSKRRHCKGVCYIPLNRGAGAAASVHGASGARASLLEAFRTNAPGQTDLRAADTEEALHAGLNKITGDFGVYPGHLVVFLDGCEQWAGRDRSSGAWSALAGFVRDLLEACPLVAVLCTSRNAISPPVSAGVSVWNAAARRRTAAQPSLDGTPGAGDEAVLEIGELSAKHTAQLLLQLSPRSLFQADIMEGDAGGHFSKLSRHQKLELLANHRVVRECRGHPIVVGQVAEKLRSRHLNEVLTEAQAAAKAFFNVPDNRQLASCHPPRAAVSGRAPPFGVAHHGNPAVPPAPATAPSAGGSRRSSSSCDAGTFAHARLAFAFTSPSAQGSSMSLPSTSSLPSSGSRSSQGASMRDLADNVCASLAALPQPGDSDAQWSVALKCTEDVLHETLYKSPRICRELSVRDLERLHFVYNRIAAAGRGQRPIREIVNGFASWLSASVNSLVSFADYWNHGVIYGLISKEHVNEMLSSRPCGTFLIRVSESVPGNFAVAYVVAPHGAPRRVVHTLVVPEPGGAVSIDFRDGRKRFDSLGAFLLGHEIFDQLWPDRSKHEVLQTVFSAAAPPAPAPLLSAGSPNLSVASSASSSQQPQSLPPVF